MATYRLGLSSKKLNEFYYSSDAWQESEKGNAARCMIKPYPVEFERILASDKHAISWFLGRAVGEKGKGAVEVIYPYISERTEGVLDMWNINFTIFPFLTLTAVPSKYNRFAGWFTEKDGKGKLLSFEKNLAIGPDDWPEETAFFAHFTDRFA